MVPCINQLLVRTLWWLILKTCVYLWRFIYDSLTILHYMFHMFKIVWLYIKDNLILVLKMLFTFVKLKIKYRDIMLANIIYIVIFLMINNSSYPLIFVVSVQHDQDVGTVPEMQLRLYWSQQQTCQTTWGALFS